MAAKTIIEINGRMYDASTGQIVGENEQLKVQVTPAKTGVIDGFQRPKHQLKSSVAPTQMSRKKAQKAQTLARNVVKKPEALAVPKKEAPKPRRELSVAESRRNILTKTPEKRLERAQATQKSSTVAKFAETIKPVRPTVSAHVPVVKEQHAINHAPIAAEPPIHVTPQATHPTSKQVFTHPLAGANAHLATPPKKRKLHQRIADTLSVSTKAVSISAACLAIIVLGGFLAYQRVPNISMRVAASKAGFSGTVPSNTPAGYAFKGPIDYTKDAITINYASNSDNRNFRIVQRPTDWNSETLLANYVSSTKMRYQTYNDRGLTVYIMEGNNAAWVNKGIWYSLSGTNTLSTEQILAMAASM